MTTHEHEPQCPPVPDTLILRYHTTDNISTHAQQLAQWGFTQALAAAQRLAADERHRGADEELDACVQFLKRELYMHSAADSLRAARRPPAPTVREQALQRMAELRDRGSHTWQDVLEAFDLAAQALEAGDER